MLGYFTYNVHLCCASIRALLILMHHFEHEQDMQMQARPNKYMHVLTYKHMLLSGGTLPPCKKEMYDYSRLL